MFIRYVKDCCGKEKFSRRKSVPDEFPHQMQVTQPFTASATVEQKKQNLRLAAQRIRRHTILPGEVFSFWRAVGNPNTSEFAASRSIRGGELMLERGGGLCQASGIIYHLSLIAGLEILERYNHSKDLYTEKTRFCPLGSDATVAYGYRDLRVKNTTSTPLYFDLQVCDDHFTALLCSEAPIVAHDIRFDRKEKPGNILEAVTTDLTTGQILQTSTYERLD